MSTSNSRRDLLRSGAALCVAAFVEGGCGRKPSATLACTDTAGLSPDNLRLRESSAYVDLAPDPRETCAGCDEFVPAGATPWGRRWPPAAPDAGSSSEQPLACGRCKVVLGPIHPNGHCRLVRPKH
jgi:hypothetical protein